MTAAGPGPSTSRVDRLVGWALGPAVLRRQGTGLPGAGAVRGPAAALGGRR